MHSAKISNFIVFELSSYCGSFFSLWPFIGIIIFFIQIAAKAAHNFSLLLWDGDPTWTWKIHWHRKNVWKNPSKNSILNPKMCEYAARLAQYLRLFVLLRYRPFRISTEILILWFQILHFWDLEFVLIGILFMITSNKNLSIRGF